VITESHGQPARLAEHIDQELNDGTFRHQRF
jgi:hypothetical protein